MWTQKGFFLLLVQISLSSPGGALWNFPTFDWISQLNNAGGNKEMKLQPEPNHSGGQEMEDLQFGDEADHKGQEVEEINFGSKPKHPEGQKVEEFHFGHNNDDHLKGQEVEEINFGHDNDNHIKGQEVEEINFGLKPKHPEGQKVEEFHFGHDNDDHLKGQEVEEINFGLKPKHPVGQEVEEINFGSKPRHPEGQKVEEFHFGHDSDDHLKGQEVEEINFGLKPKHPEGQKVEEFHFGHENDDHLKGQEVEEINFGLKPKHPVGQEVEEINFGSKPKHPEGQKVEEFHFGHDNDDHLKGQEVEEINFGSKPKHPVGQEVEEFHFGHDNDDHLKGQEVEEINFGHDNDNHIKGQEVEEINFGSKPKHPVGQAVEEFHFGHDSDDHLKGQEVEEINFGSKPHHPKKLEPEHPKGQEPEEFHFGHDDDSIKGQEIKENSENPGHWFDIFLPAIDVEGCKENPSALPNSVIKCESHRKCELFCKEGYRFSADIRKIVLECDGGKWIHANNITAECNPVCEPPCQNNGICIAKNQCSCPKNFEGTHCQLKNEPCSAHPPVSHNSYVNCNSSNCVVKCFDNYAFPDGSSTANLICNKGQWTWTRNDWNALPDCKPFCEPPCINGGSCLDFNKCQCPREFAGPQCQFEIAACDAKKLDFNGIYTCRGENDKVLCTISCPEGYYTDIPIAKEYICSYSVGKFFPEPVPKCLYEKNTDIIKFQSSSHTIQGGFEGFESSQTPHNQVPSTAECVSWKKSHYRNFDGEIFSFESNCSFILAEDFVHYSFKIISGYSNCNSNCSRYLKIFYQGNEWEIHYEGKTPILMANGELMQLPYELGGFILENLGEEILLSLQTIEVSLNWNAEDFIRITVNKEMWNKTNGLCGNFNGNPNDDFHTPEGFPSANLEAFIESWMHDPYNCKSPPVTRNNCTEDNYCRKIFSDVHFEKCSDVRALALYEKACEWDVCKCGKHCACDTIYEFVQSCKKYLINEEIPDSTSDWRQIADCQLNCGVGKVYSVCGPSLQLTCGLFGMNGNVGLKLSECVEGCFCPEGMVLFNDSCIKNEYCPCYWRNKYYNTGEVIMKDCNTCVCQKGEWTCTTLQCPSRCKVIGNSHYFTFDGRRYDLMGPCSHYLLKSDDYSITYENLPCQGDLLNEFFPNQVSRFSSCTKFITIWHKNDEIKLKPKKEILLNGREVPSHSVEIGGIVIRPTSLYVVVAFPDGSELWWDENSNVYIDVPGDYTKATGGLCGTFNNNQKDDFITPEGDIEHTAGSFAEKWKTDETCKETTNPLIPYPCDDNITYKATAESLCQKLKGDIFRECHPFVDVEPFYKNCLYDVCSCQKEVQFCICPIFADYANECTRQNVQLLWRSEIRECGLHCQNGMIYQPCGDSCSRSCQDISIMKGQCRKKCVEDCTCPEGLVVNSTGQCIPVSECPCFHQNLEYKASSTIILESENGPQFCFCKNALWSCKPATKLEIDRNYDNSNFKCDGIHEEYTTCTPAEPKTCKNMHEKAKHSTRVCFPGCVCKKGFVWDSIGRLCVNASECPCHHGGRSFADGETIQQDCNSCVCKSGVWSCTERECPSICSTWGDSHFKTFDGKIYDFQGSCEFVLAAGSIFEHSFFINVQIAPCGTTGLSCPKSVTLSVEWPGKEEKVVFKTSKQFSIPRGLKRIRVKEVGLFVFAEFLDLGVSVQWDRGTRVYVKADATWKNKVKGLCGNFNDNEVDDFKTPSSGETNEISPLLFADSWRLDSHCPESKPITDTCARRPHRKVWAVEKCSVLSSSIFEPCHSQVALEPYLERCVIDTCGCDEGGDCECLCTAIAAYAEECTRSGVPIRWRSQSLCPLQCDDSKYNPCVSKCPPKSCDNLYHDFTILRACAEESCVEGCDKPDCPSGYVLANTSSNDCVPISSCKPVCLVVHNVTYLEGDLMEKDDCHSCYCSHYTKVCTGEPCFAGKTGAVPTSTTTAVPTPTSACPEGEVWDHCIVKCGHVCNSLVPSLSGDLQCSNDCIMGCRGTDLICPHGMFLRDKHTCVLKEHCPCISSSNKMVKPGDVVQESECEKCQCINNNYECAHVCTKPPTYKYSKKKYSVTPGWEYSQQGNVTLIHFPTEPTNAIFSCPSGRYESLVDSLTKFSASSHLDESSSPKFAKMSSKGAWTAGDSNADQYLQVDLLRVEPIFAVNVAGAAGNYVTSYYLLYSLNGVKFKNLFNRDGRKEIFGGPLDGHHSVKQVLPNQVEARYIRFHPISWHGQITMKVDLLGCSILMPTTPHPITPVPSTCNKPIGIGKKYFPKLQIIVTSSKPDNGPNQIGFDSENGWQPLTNSKSEWVQLDFGDYGNFTGITTKGITQGNDLSSLLLGDSWVERYKVEYSHDGLSWNPVLDEFGDQMIFMGNTDGQTEKKNFFKRPIRAKSLKISPVKWHDNIALRLDVMGCYEPSRLEVEVTPPVVIPVTDCNLCPGALINKDHCHCGEDEWWNGENCVSHSECPCYKGLMAYPVGSTFTNENCEECVCRLYGLSHCVPKHCPDCPNDLQKVVTPLCDCNCKPCGEKTRLCPTSNICLKESAWCDGIQDCPDDELNCTTPTQKVIPKPIPCLPACPPGYNVVYRNKTAGPTEAEDMIQSERVKSVKTSHRSKSVKTYRKSKKNRKLQKLTECPPYDCVPAEVRPSECPPPECPVDYSIVYKAHNDGLKEACPLYACEPVPEYANCSVSSKVIKTFDKLQYKYEICDHVLATHDSGLWNVSALKNCSFDGICTTVLVINHKNHTLELHSHRLIKFDSFPYTIEQLELLSSKTADFTLNILGDSTIFKSDIYGFEVVYDVKGNFYIKVPTQMKGHLTGLCGLYNGDPSDDRTLPDGKLSKTNVEFGDSWLNSGGKECKEIVCPIEMQNAAFEICLKLKEKPFNSCHTNVNLELCVESTCACLAANETWEECKCQVLSDFASKCSGSNLIGWRLEHDCSSPCPPNLVHYDCYPYACEPTCGNKECTQPATECYRGCFCPDGLVKRGDQCIKVTECRDCVCSGLGNSTYLTFDEVLTFNGNCTYVATRVKTSSGAPAFQVFIRNKLCDGSNFMTCTDEIEMSVQGHSVKVIALPNTDEMVKVLIDEHKENIQETQKLEKNWARITFSPEIYAVHVELPHEHADVRFYYKRFAFTISIPSHLYSGKVEGLCGTCSQDVEEPDEMDNPEKWQIENDENCLIEPPAPCLLTEDHKKICFLMNDTTMFGQCLAFVDPTPFIDQCLTLICTNGHFCNSLEAYGQACRDTGVCVNWRTDDFCPFTCPSGLQYQACNIGCQKTCDNYEEISSICTSTPLEGCFCPHDQILINGTCKPEKYCKFCDENGHHFEGELWRVDRCTNCSCRNRVVTCETTECTETDATCGQDEVLLKEENDFDCCPKHKCVCRPRDECEKIEIPSELLPGMEAVVNESSCCPRVELVCRPERCPKPKPCREHYVEKIYNTSNCCPDRLCVKPDDICIYELGGSSMEGQKRVKREQKTEIVKEIGERWTDGPCKTCVCAEKDGFAETICSVTECASLETHHDYKDYDLDLAYDPEICCPQVVRVSCKHDGRVYKVGDTWTPNDSNPCETMKCSAWGGSGVTKETRLEVCNENCELGWSYERAEGACCGHCVQTGCLAGEKVYKAGEVWFSEDKCAKNTCTERNGHYSISTEMKRCPSVEDCPLEDIYQDDCCLKCKIRPENKKLCEAQSLPLEATVQLLKQKNTRHGQCHNERPIRNFTRCAGICDSYTEFNADSGSHDSVCKCCQPQEYSLLTVTLDCEDGTELTKTITVPSKCSCMPCGG